MNSFCPRHVERIRLHFQVNVQPQSGSLGPGNASFTLVLALGKDQVNISGCHLFVNELGVFAKLRPRLSIHCVLLGAAVTLQLTQKIRQLNLWQ